MPENNYGLSGISSSILEQFSDSVHIPTQRNPGGETLSQEQLL